MKKILLFLCCAICLVCAKPVVAESAYYNIASNDLFAKPTTIVEMANGNLFIVGYRSTIDDGLLDYGIYGIFSKTGTVIKNFVPIQSPLGYGYDRKIDNTCFNPLAVALDRGNKVLVSCLTKRYSNNSLSGSLLHFNIYDQNGSVVAQKTYSTFFGDWNLSVLPYSNSDFAIFYSKSAMNGTGVESTKFKVFDINGNEVVSEKNPIIYNRCRGAVAVNLDNGNFVIGYSDNSDQYACQNDRYAKNNWALVGKGGSIIQKNPIGNIGYFDKSFRFKNGDIGLGFFEMGSSASNYDKKYRMFIFDSTGNYKDSLEIISFGNNSSNYDYRFFKILQGKQTGNFLALNCTSSPSSQCSWISYDKNFNIIQQSIAIGIVPASYLEIFDAENGKMITDYYKLNSAGNAFTAKAFEIISEPSTISLTIRAGSAKRVLAGKTVAFSDATTSQPLNININYSWECKDSAGKVISGLLSATNILKPIFTAPIVTSQTKYYCTLTAKEISK